jgi:hypothetical protein
LNCTCVPITAAFGVTAMVGAVKEATMVVFAFNVTLQVTVVAEVHPDQELNVWEPAFAGAVTVTAAPAL